MSTLRGSSYSSERGAGLTEQTHSLLGVALGMLVILIGLIMPQLSMSMVLRMGIQKVLPAKVLLNAVV